MIQLKVSLYVGSFILTHFARPHPFLVVSRMTQRTNASHCFSPSCQHRRSLPKLVSRTDFPAIQCPNSLCKTRDIVKVHKSFKAQRYKIDIHSRLLSEYTKACNKYTVTNRKRWCDALSCFPDLDAEISTKTPCGQHGLRGVWGYCKCHSMVGTSFLFRCCSPWNLLHHLHGTLQWRRQLHRGVFSTDD